LAERDERERKMSDTGSESSGGGETDRDLLGDPVLAGLVDVVREVGAVHPDSDTGVGITLVVGGAVLSGILAGPRKWWEDQTKLAIGAIPGGGKAKAAEMAADKVAAFVAKTRQEMFENGEADSEIGYLHLRNVTVVTPTGRMPLSGGIMIRLQIEQVQAWSFGVVPRRVAD
jgi:hypothetical protein